MGAAEKRDEQRVWLTTKEAAEYANMSKRCLLEHVARGTLVPDSRARPGFKVHRFLRSTLDRWLKGDNDNGG